MTSVIAVVMGVSGSGKSTVGRLLADDLQCAFVDADDLHSDANKRVMAAGIPLTDEDRAPWLVRVAAVIDAEIGGGHSLVLACSALRRRYRDVLRRPEVVFVLLDGSREVLAHRLAQRTDHFMPAVLLNSQLATLERPGADERSLTVPIDRSASEIARGIAARLGQCVRGAEDSSQDTKPV